LRLRKNIPRTRHHAPGTITTAKRLVVFDLDGVIYRGDELLPRVVETLADIRRRKIFMRFMTNNSTRTRKFYCEKMRRMGIDAWEDEIVSSSYAAAWYLRKNAPSGAKVFIVGEDGLRDELLAVCDIVDEKQLQQAEYVVVGLDREFNYKKLANAMSAILMGAKFIATNLDPDFPASGGRLLPGGGAIVAALEMATGVKPLVIGKPEPLMMELVLDTADVKREEILLIGDRAATDIVAGKRAGVETCLVLTGVTTPQEAKMLPPELTPDCVVNDLGGVLNILDETCGN